MPKVIPNVKHIGLNCRILKYGVRVCIVLVSHECNIQAQWNCKHCSNIFAFRCWCLYILNELWLTVCELYSLVWIDYFVLACQIQLEWHCFLFSVAVCSLQIHCSNKFHSNQAPENNIVVISMAKSLFEVSNNWFFIACHTTFVVFFFLNIPTFGFFSLHEVFLPSIQCRLSEDNNIIDSMLEFAFCIDTLNMLVGLLLVVYTKSIYLPPLNG